MLQVRYYLQDTDDSQTCAITTTRCDVSPAAARYSVIGRGVQKSLRHSNSFRKKYIQPVIWSYALAMCSRLQCCPNHLFPEVTCQCSPATKTTQGPHFFTFFLDFRRIHRNVNPIERRTLRYDGELIERFSASAISCASVRSRSRSIVGNLSFPLANLDGTTVFTPGYAPATVFFVSILCVATFQILRNSYLEHR